MATGAYEHSALYKPLTKTVKLVHEVSDVLSADARLISDPDFDGVRTGLKAALPGGGLAGRSLVVGWSGHGATVDQKLRLVTRDTGQPTEIDTFSPTVLAELTVRSGAEHILLIVDTCYAAAGVLPLLQVSNLITDSASQTPSIWLGVLAAAMSYAEAVEGALLCHLREMLQSTSPDVCAAVWSPHNRYLRGDEVLWGLVQAWRSRDDQRPHQANQGHARPLLPNPRYSPAGE